jgi:hypothetical protein
MRQAARRRRTRDRFAEQLYLETNGRIPPSRDYFARLWPSVIRIVDNPPHK